MKRRRKYWKWPQIGWMKMFAFKKMCHPQKYDTRIATQLLHHDSTGRAICSIHSFCGTHWLSFHIFLIRNHFCALHAWRTQRRRIRKPILSYQERITGLMADWKDIIHCFFIILTAVFSLLAVCSAVVRATRFRLAVPLYCRAFLLHIFFKFHFVCFTSLVLQRMPFISFINWWTRDSLLNKLNDYWNCNIVMPFQLWS